MKTSKLFSTVITGTRLLLLIAMLMAAVLGSVQRAEAAPLLSLQTITVGAQTGSLVAGTPGSVTFDLTVTRTGKTPNSVSFSVTGLPAETSFSILALTGWSSQSRTYQLTISTTAAAAAGQTVFTVSSNSGTNTTISGTGTLTILAAGGSQTITFDPLADKTFGDPDFTVSATASSGLPVSFAAAGNCTVTGDLVSLTGAGSCTITASQAGYGTWSAAADVSQSFAIAKADQTITFDPLADRYTFEPDFTVSATASSGLAVSFAAAGNCTVTGDSVHLLSPGSCTITASQIGDANFNAATDVPQTFTISDFPAVSYELFADEGSTTLAGASIPVWGYYEIGGAVTQPGGPTLIVNAGDKVTIALHNNLSEPTALLFQGQDMIPDVSGVPAGAVKIYTFDASRPGTYLYEASPLLANAQHQVAMGLYGALVVLPATAGQAYGAGTDFDDEAVLVLSDLDPALNNSANPATFDMRNYAPKYFMINGKVYPGTDPIPTTAGNTVLLRYVNAGLQAYSMAVLGVRQTMIAMDGSPLPYGRSLVAETLAPGQTADMLVEIPAAAADGSQFALYDANLFLHNNKANNSLAGSFGGMLTFLNVSGTPPTGDTVGPLTSGLSVTATSVSATISDFGRGGSNVTAAEFFIDTTGANGSGTAMNSFSPAITVSVSATLSLTGSHTIYVHGMDAAGNWGPFQSALFGVDSTGPATSALALSPNPSNGSVSVALSGTASDTASGGSNIAAAEYSIDGGTAFAMSVSPAGAKTASLSASIPAATVAGLVEDTHVVSVRSQDSLGNWGIPATINLVVDKTGPGTINVSAAKNPNNGTIAYNSSVQAVRVTAFSKDLDLASKISAMEGFIDTVGTDGTGIIFLPVDGSFNNTEETGYADILLSTVAALSDGNHTIYVHAKDTAGNWGATSSTILVIDKTAPMISSATLTPSTIAFGAASVTLNVTASDGLGTGVSGGQFWIDGTATPPANATAFTGTSTAIDTSALAGGTHTVYVRVKDVVGNWSAVSSVTLYVVQAVNDSRTITANTSTTQTVDVTAADGVLANDQPVGVAGRTATLASAPVRTSGTGAGTITITCPSSLGTPASPAINGNTVCTNGAYRVTLTSISSNSGTQRRTSKLGTYEFTYTETLNGATSTAKVTIIVN